MQQYFTTQTLLLIYCAFVGLNDKLHKMHGTCIMMKATWYYMAARGGVVVKALRYKPAGRGFDSRWCHWNFSVT